MIKVQPTQPRQKITPRKERGDTLLTIIGAIGLMLAVGMIGTNAGQLHSARSSLSAAARSAVLFGASALPNVEFTAKRVLGSLTTEVPLRGILKDVRARVVIRSPSRLDGSTQVESETVIATCTVSAERLEPPNQRCSDLDLTLDLSAVRYPVSAVSVELSAEVPLTFLSFEKVFGESSATPTITVNAKAAARLAPTDVMLVIENSNSLISSIENSSGEVESPNGETTEIFESGTHALIDTKRNIVGPLANRLQLGAAWERQCFGKNVIELKRAALKAYDLLSSSATFRVGAIHTPVATGDPFDPTIYPTDWVNDPFFPYPHDDTARIYGYEPPSAPTPSPGQQRNYLYNVGDEAPLSAGHPESRCAALTSDTDYQLPPHPFNLGQGVPTRRDLSSSVVTTKPVASDDEAARRAWLGFQTGTNPARFFPREVLWLPSAGSTALSGEIQPAFTHNRAHVAIQRAIDVLHTLPARRDGLVVRRRVVIALIDGFDREEAQGRSPYLSQRGEETLMFTEYASSRPGSNPARPIATGYTSRPCESYCHPSCGVPNSIYQAVSQEPDPSATPATTPDPNLGVKLGILLMSSRDEDMDAADPHYPLVNLSGHFTPAGEVPEVSGGIAGVDAITDARSKCQSQRWGNFRGITYLEAPRGDYSASLIPAFVRALQVAELEE